MPLLNALGRSAFQRFAFVGRNDQLRLCYSVFEAINHSLRFRKDVAANGAARFQFLDERAVLCDLRAVPFDVGIVVHGRVAFNARNGTMQGDDAPSSRIPEIYCPIRARTTNID